MFLILLPLCAFSSTPAEVETYLDKGYKCDARWSDESSLYGQKTEIDSVKLTDQGYQYYVHHSTYRRWVWVADFRIADFTIKCAPKPKPAFEDIFKGLEEEAKRNQQSL
ncbi:hypothetical protein [Vibrio atypicus]|uniref:hypothetical protein n=1 Tax=Vibrio atypicus TaxID=558271 RepID=UPI00135AB614|nr:hypothetical protein [Vibrio atypicus]